MTQVPPSSAHGAMAVATVLVPDNDYYVFASLLSTQNFSTWRVLSQSRLNKHNTSKNKQYIESRIY